MRRPRLCATLACLLTLPLLLGFTGPSCTVAPATATTAAEPPGVPAAATAREQLAALVERAPGSMAGYSRDRFPHWSDQPEGCDTRDAVLRRDGTDIQLEEGCNVVGGRWVSPYDGGVWTDPQDVDIDHVVALAEAWRSGAAEWDDGRREEFANDLSGPQLIAVTDSVNQAKGDQAPHQWRPQNRGYWCTYARMWIGSKSRWGLSIVSAERTALTEMLDTCG